MLLSKKNSFLNKISIFIFKLTGKNKVYYINGSETLPPPLSSEVEEEMTVLCDFKFDTVAAFEEFLFG